MQLFDQFKNLSEFQIDLISLLAFLWAVVTLLH